MFDKYHRRCNSVFIDFKAVFGKSKDEILTSLMDVMLVAYVHHTGEADMYSTYRARRFEDQLIHRTISIDILH